MTMFNALLIVGISALAAVIVLYACIVVGARSDSDNHHFK